MSEVTDRDRVGGDKQGEQDTVTSENNSNNNNNRGSPTRGNSILPDTQPTQKPEYIDAGGMDEST